MPTFGLDYVFLSNASAPCAEDFTNKKYILPTGWELTKKNKWQYHKNPEAGSADHQAAGALSPAVVDLTKAVSEADLPPAKKQSIVSIILSGYHKCDWLVIM